MPPTHVGVTRISILFLSNTEHGALWISSIIVIYLPEKSPLLTFQGVVICLRLPFGRPSPLSWGLDSQLAKQFPFVSLVSLFVVVLLVSQGKHPKTTTNTFPSRIGAMYHVPFPVVARVSFGMWGCIPAILVRTFVALMVILHIS